MIEIEDSSTRQSLGSYPVSANGHFELTGVSSGSYLVTVRNSQGAVATQIVNIGGQISPLSIQLPTSSIRERPAPVSDSTVSVHRLTHKVPKAAKKQYNKALSAGNDHATVIACLEKAIEIDPEYVEALNNLGSRYVVTQQYNKAVSVLEKASAVDPTSPFVHTNLASAYLAVQRLEDAEQAARTAVQLSGSDIKPRYLLGLALFMQKKFTAEAVSHLRSARNAFPNSALALATIAYSRGEKKEARTLVEQYLASGRTDRRAQAERLLTALR